MSKRLEIQNNAKEKIIQCNYHGLTIVSPRVGKSKLTLDAIKDKSDWNIVISSPYDAIKDSWSSEIIKWELGFNPKLICSASLKKLESDIDLLILDEIQMLSSSQINWILKKKPKRILGLTGTLDPETQMNLWYTLKIKPIFTYSIEQAIEDNIISNFEIEVILCNFDNELQDIISGTKAKPKLATELGHYEYLTSQFERFRIMSYGDAQYETMKMMYANRRRTFIYESLTKLNIAKDIANRIDRCIIFTGLIKQAEELSIYSYHSKNKLDNNLVKFQEGSIDKLSVVQLSNLGITIPNLKRAVIHQLQSNSEMSIQKILRTCNLEDDRTAKIYITCYDDSVDKEWLEKALSGIKQNRIKWTKLEDFRWNEIS